MGLVASILIANLLKYPKLRLIEVTVYSILLQGVFIWGT